MEDKCLYYGERKKPKNLWDIRSAREMFEDPENIGKRNARNNVRPDNERGRAL